MHLQGRVLLEVLPRAVDGIDGYEWMDGEMVAGLVLGWNFGDGHLNKPAARAIQEQCGFEAGELRVVMVESQPLFGRTMRWRIVDAATGVFDEGETEIAPLRAYSRIRPVRTQRRTRGRTKATSHNAPMADLDAAVVGAGPNGLAAACALAARDASVARARGGADTGGGTRTASLTQPGFLHDVCSAIHPMGISPFFRTLPLANMG